MVNKNTHTHTITHCSELQCVDRLRPSRWSWACSTAQTNGDRAACRSQGAKGLTTGLSHWVGRKISNDFVRLRFFSRKSHESTEVHTSTPPNLCLPPTSNIHWKYYVYIYIYIYIKSYICHWVENRACSRAHFMLQQHSMSLGWDGGGWVGDVRIRCTYTHVWCYVSTSSSGDVNVLWICARLQSTELAWFSTHFWHIVSRRCQCSLNVCTPACYGIRCTYTHAWCYVSTSPSGDVNVLCIIRARPQSTELEWFSSHFRHIVSRRCQCNSRAMGKPPQESYKKIVDSRACEFLGKNPNGTSSCLLTDGAPCYPKVAAKCNAKHFYVNHSQGEFQRKNRFQNKSLSVHTGTIDSCWKQMKTHIPKSLGSTSNQVPFRIRSW